MARLLLVEDRSHLARGHFRQWLAQLTCELTADGHDVHVLTRRPWDPAPEGGVADEAHRHLLARPARWALALAEAIEAKGHERGLPLGPYLLAFARALATVAIVGGARGVARGLGGPDEVVVIVLSMTADSIWVTASAPLRGRWSHYTHRSPIPAGSRPGRVAQRCSRGLALEVDRWRRRTGGRFRVLANGDLIAEDWERYAGWLDIVVVPSGAREEAVAPSRAEARARLGLPADGLIALHFGDTEAHKDVGAILRAFADDDPPGRLIVAGHGAARQLAAAAGAEPWRTFDAVTILDGYRTEEEKLLLHAACDVVVLSFVAHKPGDSGTLGDAVAHDRPLCCSDAGIPGELVRRYGLGTLFVPGDPTSLREALEAALVFEPDRAGRAAYLSERSPRVLARLLAVAAISSAAQV